MAVVLCSKCAASNPASSENCLKCGASLNDAIPSFDNGADVPDTPEDICQIGEVINGRYIVLSLIGRGGMGAVYKVRDNVLEEELALKILLPQFVADETIVERFINEVRITRKIAHPNIVRVHDIGKMGDSLFISMEYVDGESLRSILDQRGPGARLSVRQTIYIVMQLCIALKYAHRYTIHRDIKPDNIMVTRHNHIKLMDFGISKLLDERFDNNAADVVGTPVYMAPEQLHHAPDVDGRADIYSMGVVMYELISGQLPTGMPRPLSYLFDDVPPEFDRILFKCIDPDPGRRYSDPHELREALRIFLEGWQESSTPGIAAAEPQASDAATPTFAPSNFAGVMEAFLNEERSRDGFSGRDISSHNSRSDAGVPGGESNGAIAQLNNAGVIEQMLSERPQRLPATVPVASRHWLLEPSTLVRGFVVVVLVIFVVLGLTVVQKYTAEPVLEQTVMNEEVVIERLEQKLSASGRDIVAALRFSILACEQEDSLENREVLEIIRNMAIEDIEERLYSRPFDIKKMNSASNDITRASQLDTDARIRNLEEEIKREVAQFKFVLTAIDAEHEQATFRLNNAYNTTENETVQVGDLLQGRFIVSHIGARAVVLEDTHPRCARRRLTARIMEPVSAE